MPIFVYEVANEKEKEVKEVEVVDLDSIEGSSTSEGEEDGEGQGGGEAEDVSDEEYAANVDEEVDRDNISVDDSDYDESWDWTSVLPLETDNSTRHKEPTVSSTEGGGFDDINIGGGSNVRVAASSRNKRATSFADFLNEDGDSDLLETPPGSEDDEEARPKFPKFRMIEDD